MKRPSQKENALALLANAPDGWKGPDWVERNANRKTRSDKGNHQEETSFFLKLIKPFRSFERLSWKAGDIWIARNNNGSYEIPNGNGARVTYGLGPGTSDGIGWTCILVTPAMVGKTLAIFTALEAKKLPTDKPSPKQQIFLNAVDQAGGISRIVYAKPSLNKSA